MWKIEVRWRTELNGAFETLPQLLRPQVLPPMCLSSTFPIGFFCLNVLSDLFKAFVETVLLLMTAFLSLFLPTLLNYLLNFGFSLPR